MPLIVPIKVEGLAQFARNLRKLDKELPKALRIAHNEASDVVVSWAKPRVPTKSGKAQRSVKARSTRTEARVVGGSARVPYYPWLDFGGRVGKSKSVRRPFIKSGRYIYPGLMNNWSEVEDVLLRALLQVANEAGVEVT